ncbi:RNA-binding protein [Enhydrobacter sp.]|uniref:RNA-binding protein n=1 Tax=Enhydrobacter sp. TaxID=1894999 RepID=UPI002625D0B9|nr:RNA-binding protein [Enhydrobacter sp.]
MPAMTRFDEKVAAASARPVRTCLVTGAEGNPEQMLRFVVGPEGEVVPDLARRLPGRGMWLTAERAAVEQAVARRLFSKAARAPVTAPADLADRVERLLRDRVLEDLGRARRAGRAVTGFVRVEQMIGQGRAGLLIVPEEADGDGLAKLQASGLPVERLADAAALGGVFGREQAVYVAVARDDRSGRFIERIAGGAARWRRYRLDGAG